MHIYYLLHIGCRFWPVWNGVKVCVESHFNYCASSEKHLVNLGSYIFNNSKSSRDRSYKTNSKITKSKKGSSPICPWFCKKRKGRFSPNSVLFFEILLLHCSFFHLRLRIKLELLILVLDIKKIQDTLLQLVSRFINDQSAKSVFVVVFK